MYSLKSAAIVQSVLLLVALAFSILYWIMAAIGRGMNPSLDPNSAKVLLNFHTAYEYLWYFIAALLILKLVLLFLLKENFVLPIGGLIAFIVFVILNWANYKASGSIRMSAYDFIYFPMLVLLLVNSVVYLTMAIKVLKT